MKKIQVMLAALLLAATVTMAQDADKKAQEEKHGELMMQSMEKQDWVNFGKYYALYFETAYDHSKYHINNISWVVFERVTDPKVLKIAAKTAKYSVEKFAKNDPNDIDTHANLEYKLGNKKTAIELEEKAVKIEAENAAKENRTPNNVFSETLAKMKAGKKTWPE